MIIDNNRQIILTDVDGVLDKNKKLIYKNRGILYFDDSDAYSDWLKYII